MGILGQPTASNAGAVASISPQNVARSVTARVARLGDPASAVAAAVAVFGQGATLALAARLAGVDDRVADAATARLLLDAGRSALRRAVPETAGRLRSSSPTRNRSSPSRT